MHASCAHEERATVFGQEHSSRAALEQLNAKLMFELVNGARNCGLRAKQGGAGLICAAVIGNRKERSQVAQLRLHLSFASKMDRNGGSLSNRDRHAELR